MKRFFALFWLAILLAFPTGGRERASLASILPILDAYIEKSMAEEGVPGAVMVVVKDGKIVHLKGYGIKVWGQKDPVDGHTPFALASLTKNFTVSLVARLVDQGKLRWTDRVQAYLPDFRLNDDQVSEELRIEDMLSHRSGLPGFTADSMIELGWRADEIIPVMKTIPLEGAFRKTYEYQNAIVGIVGRILEKVTGKPLPQLYQEELFQPVGLIETHIGDRDPPTFWQKIWGFFQKRRPQPTFHDVWEGKTRPMPQGNPGLYTFPASSGVNSTGEDIGRWLIFQLNQGRVGEKTLISEANLKAMRTPYVDVPIQGGRQFPKNRVTKVQYGMGWFLHDYGGVSLLSHMGGMRGTRTILFMIPQENMGVAVLTNFGGMRVSLFPEAIRNKFLDLYLNIPDDQDWAKILREEMRASQDKYAAQRRLVLVRNPAPARDLDTYAGEYENALYGRVSIRRQENALVLIYRDRAPVKLTHWNGNTFQFQGSNLSFGFSGTDLGEVIFSQEPGKSSKMMITLFHEGADPLFRRVR